MNRRILRGFDAAGIGIASAAYHVVGLPPIGLEGLLVWGGLRGALALGLPADLPKRPRVFVALKIASFA